MKHCAQQVRFASSLTPDLQYTNVTTISNKVYARARQRDGVPVYVEQKYLPYHYIPVADEAQATHRGYDGTPLISHMSTSLHEAREWKQQCKVPVYGDIQAEYMVLADSYGAADVQFDMDRLYMWNIDLEVDSEHGFAKPDDPFAEVTAATVKWRHMGKCGTVVYGRKDYVCQKDELYIPCDSEEELLLRVLDDLKSGGDYPDIITGWNVQFYDIPYFVARLRKLFTEDVWETISPFNRVSDRTVIILHRSQRVVDIRGIAILDYLELYRKFTYSQQESYRLDHIASVELGMRKLSFAEFKNLRTLYRLDHQKFIEYNIQDVELVDLLDQKLKLIELVCALAYGSKSNFVDTMKQVRLWDIMIYHKLRGEGLQIPPRKDVQKTHQYAGAYVKDPIPGFYKWVVSFDVASMYPHIIREWNLSPETRYDQKVPELATYGKPVEQVNGVVERLLSRKYDTSDVKAHNLCVAANGLMTDRDNEGFLPNMMKTLYDERIKFKKMQKAEEAKLQNEADPAIRAQLVKNISAYENQQKVRKVNLNSAYGALGSNYFRFFDVDIAEAVTVTGQVVIRWIANDINGYLNRQLKTSNDYIIASDTDSVYINVEKIADVIEAQCGKDAGDPSRQKMVDLLDGFCKAKIQPLIDQSFKDIADYFHVALPCMSMVRDVIADNCIWTGKKHYSMNVYDSEGVRQKNKQQVPEPKLKVMGMEMVKSSTPAIVRKMLKDALNIIVLNGTQADMWAHIVACEKKFRAGGFEDIAKPSTINGLAVVKKVDTIQKTAVHTYNRALEQRNLTSTYELVRDGEKIKLAYLREPNPFFSHVIGATDGCPPEFEIEKWLDYTVQYDKTFLTPLRQILTTIGWTTVRSPSVFD